MRLEELTRIPSEVQDALITILSEKALPIPELGHEVQATKGFNLIATANNRDRGVNELSSARRRVVVSDVRGGKGTMPVQLAEAQVSYECWMEEQEEDFQAKVAAAQEAAVNFAAAADTGDRAAITKAFGAVGGSCKGCHDDYKQAN